MAEYQRRVQNREDRIRARHRRIGDLLVILTNDPTNTTAWKQGAAGEVAVAKVLDALPDVIALHDRSQLRNGRRSKANIDHLAIAPTGVWVVDAKTHRGKLEVRQVNKIWQPRDDRLFINSRDQTKLVEGLAKQVTTVEELLEANGLDVPVYGALCFVGTDLGWTSKSIFGIPLIGTRPLRKLVSQPGPLDVATRQVVAGLLHARFVPADC